MNEHSAFTPSSWRFDQFTSTVFCLTLASCDYMLQCSHLPWHESRGVGNWLRHHANGTASEKGKWYEPGVTIVTERNSPSQRHLFSIICCCRRCRLSDFRNRSHKIKIIVCHREKPIYYDDNVDNLTNPKGIIPHRNYDICSSEYISVSTFVYLLIHIETICVCVCVSVETVCCDNVMGGQFSMIK